MSSTIPYLFLFFTFLCDLTSGQDVIGLTYHSTEDDGTWGRSGKCPDGTSVYAVTAAFGVDDANDTDNVGLFRLEMECQNAVCGVGAKKKIQAFPSGTSVKQTAEDQLVCGDNGVFVYGIQLRVHAYGATENTKATGGIKIFCRKLSDGTTVPERTSQDRAGTPGLWGPLLECPEDNQFVCGYQTMVQPYQGKEGDDTAINEIRIRCCRYV